ncbi:hypothetical protein ACVIU4_000919 [Bradyrhizobium barranii subsp. barranii]
MVPTLSPLCVEQAELSHLLTSIQATSLCSRISSTDAGYSVHWRARWKLILRAIEQTLFAEFRYNFLSDLRDQFLPDLSEEFGRD